MAKITISLEEYNNLMSQVKMIPKVAKQTIALMEENEKLKAWINDVKSGEEDFCAGCGNSEVWDSSDRGMCKTCELHPDNN